MPIDQTFRRGAGISPGEALAEDAVGNVRREVEEEGFVAVFLLFEKFQRARGEPLHVALLFPERFGQAEPVGVVHVKARDKVPTDLVTHECRRALVGLTHPLGILRQGRVLGSKFLSVVIGDGRRHHEVAVFLVAKDIGIVPLADKARGVARRVQSARQMPLARVNVGVELDVRRTRHGMLLPQRSAPAGVLPGQQRIPAGRADRGVDIKLRESLPLPDQPVELRRERTSCFPRRLSGEGGVAVVRQRVDFLEVQIVGKDNEDVGLFDRRIGGMEAGQRREQEGVEERFHKLQCVENLIQSNRISSPAPPLKVRYRLWVPAAFCSAPEKDRY